MSEALCGCPGVDGCSICRCYCHERAVEEKIKTIANGWAPKVSRELMVEELTNELRDLVKLVRELK